MPRTAMLEVDDHTDEGRWSPPPPQPDRTVADFFFNRDHFAGVDVGESAYDYCVVNLRGWTVAHGKVGITPSEVAKMRRDLDRFSKPGLPIPIAMEGTSSIIQPTLVDAGYPVFLISSKIMKDGRGSSDSAQTKTDKIDAHTLAKLSLTNQGKWAPIVKDCPETIAMSVIARAELDELKRSMKLAQQTRALLTRYFPLLLTDKMFSTTELRKIKVMNLLIAPDPGRLARPHGR